MDNGKLRVHLIQTASALDPETNRATLAAHPTAAAHTAGDAACDSDLVVLPEAFARDFGEPGSALGEYAEPLDGPFATELDRVAAECGNTWLAGMFETSGDPGLPYNTLLLAGQERASYRKIHLYDSFGFQESDQIAPGPLEPVVVKIGDFPVGLMTCYDLRFPELARALTDKGAEAIVMPAAWVAGERKVDHWRTLMIARAIENTVWMVGVAQPGPRYTGHSMVVSPVGDVIVEAGTGEECLDAVLDRASVAAARRTNPSVANRRM